VAVLSLSENIRAEITLLTHFFLLLFVNLIELK